MSRMPEVGEVVDDVFRIESELDHGNFGAVYRAHDVLEDRTLALKVLKPGPHDEQELRQRFEREARLIYSLRHPHVLRVYYYGQTASGLPYMAMEFLEGTDLKTLLRHHGALNRRLVQRITLETLSALEAAHELGIVHRDLKPANIFLVNDGGKGHVKVLDFGFAKALEDDNSEDLTAAKTLVGTPAYMAPELVHKKNVGPVSDLYAVGLIMAEMLTGDKIVQIESVYDTILFQASDKPIKMPPVVRDSIFRDIIERAVEKEVDRRYANATDMILDLEALDLEPAARSATPTDSVAVPSEFGQADEEAMTTPHSLGLPSMQQVDQKLADGGWAQNQDRGPSPRRSIDPFADFPTADDDPADPTATTSKRSNYEVSPTDSATNDSATTSKRSGYETAPLGSDNTAVPDPGPAPVTMDADTTTEFSRDDHARAVGFSSDASGYEARGPQEPAFAPDDPLDMQRPSSSADRRPSSPSVWKEVVLGVVIGALILLGFLYFLAQ
ncbi:MAG: serine/threonine-protein kinase [Persicimonas sp.]